jgi:DNA-binding transcriptional ArsR family regulator
VNQLLWHLLAGTRGGTNRLRILDELLREPANAQQLADRLCVDYRTVRHHLDILIDNGLLAKREGGAYGARLFASSVLMANRGALEEIHAHIRRDAERAEARRRPRPTTAGGD